MALNFSEWQDSFIDPQYQAEGKEPKCPEGHKWDKSLQTCVPDNKNGENPSDRQMPDPIMAYNVWGTHGLNGEAPAIAVPGNTVDESAMYHPTEKDNRRQSEEEIEHKKQDDRMRYGKSGKSEEDSLQPGEVKRYDKNLKRWVSNKEGK